MAKSFVSVVSLLAILVAQPARAQIFESVGVRAQGMGGGFVALADDATATWWNPAGLAAGAYFNLLVEYDRSRMPPETSVKGLAIGFPALGLSYYRLPINQMRRAASTGTTDFDRQDQGVLGVYGLTAGESLGHHLVVASTLKLERSADTHGDLDMGAIARFGVMRLGLTVKNLRKPTLATDGGPLTLERQARAGVALVGHTTGLISDMAVALDADLTATPTPVGDVRHVGGGFEVWTFGKRVGIRAGTSGNTVGERRPAASGGVSVAVSMGGYLKTYVDGQVTGGSDESRRGWSVGVRATF